MKVFHFRLAGRAKLFGPCMNAPIFTRRRKSHVKTKVMDVTRFYLRGFADLNETIQGVYGTLF
jgi:hypothetical protein